MSALEKLAQCNIQIVPNVTWLQVNQSELSTFAGHTRWPTDSELQHTKHEWCIKRHTVRTHTAGPAMRHRNVKLLVYLC